MIDALRARHRWMTAAMGLAAGGGLVAALAARPAPVTMSALPDALLTAPSTAPARLSGGDLWDGAEIDTTVYPDQIALTVREPLRAPAPLLYWAPVRPAVGDGGVPAGARLLGTVGDGPAQRFALSSDQGALLIFSLGRSKVVATLSLEAP